MPSGVVRLLFLADTHLGFDLPFRPRIHRRRRGPDFFANFEGALEPALRGEVDLVVHGGDLLYRTRVPPALVEMAMQPLVRVADRGVPVYLVPGNHERSRIPLHLWASHPNIHIFDRPKTYLLSTQEVPLALSGFPFARNVREDFLQLVSRTGYPDAPDGVRLLCMHQTVEGAQVGTADYTFRSGTDVIAGQAIPGAFDAILAGHIHRSQMLTHTLDGRPLAAPVIYPGSIERTSFAERQEEKGYMIITLAASGGAGSPIKGVEVRPLPTRPMINLVLQVPGQYQGSLEERLGERLRGLDPNAVVRVQLRGPGAEAARRGLAAARLRALAPPTMNIVMAYDWQATEGGKR